MDQIERGYKKEYVSVVHVHLVYEEMLTQITNMCDIFNLGVPDRGKEPLYDLVRVDIKQEAARIAQRNVQNGSEEANEMRSEVSSLEDMKDVAPDEESSAVEDRPCTTIPSESLVSSL